ncbi:MAG: excalibur calcium-binding domain-containing protein [Actinomyces urogenitalis]|uniref:Excalibur calcium-binding domain-containing protein n=1 Tax=Actinomyces urogenitalis TaxID=103621 RepID=A0A2I1KR05_9ACTO|nr:excalibur calcium-binding domain-containing protein [Actinomyces urogenitalis]MDU0972922.1 excalibur calcium-binding domain-containing protein [Actinomyces urogenitalis]PKY98059.1 hypothetical protein CYJ26_09675 [Actinomyces urogenitalis]
MSVSCPQSSCPRAQEAAEKHESSRSRVTLAARALMAGAVSLSLLGLAACGGGDETVAEDSASATVVDTAAAKASASAAAARASASAEAAAQQAAAQQAAANTYYPNCAAARAAGAAPIYRGEPGYSGKLDRDGSGVACE